MFMRAIGFHSAGLGKCKESEECFRQQATEFTQCGWKYMGRGKFYFNMSLLPVIKCL